MKKKTEMVLRRRRDQTPCEKLRMQQETQGMNVYVERERETILETERRSRFVS